MCQYSPTAGSVFPDSCKTAVYRFEGKNWDSQVDSENGNYDYLMGADLDMSAPALERWWNLKWRGTSNRRITCPHWSK